MMAWGNGYKTDKIPGLAWSLRPFTFSPITYHSLSDSTAAAAFPTSTPSSLGFTPPLPPLSPYASSLSRQASSPRSDPLDIPVRLVLVASLSPRAVVAIVNLNECTL